MAEALKEMFDAARFRQLAGLLAEAQAGFDRKRFIDLATRDLAALSLLQRLRQGTAALHATLPADYPAALAVLHRIAPHIGHSFVGLMLPDFVGVYGHRHFRESMAALHAFTRFSSGEFAIREFLRRDQSRTLAVMERWSRDENEHVRRLASEGSRPRLPWSFRLESLIADPSPTRPILENLRADPSPYVRKSVANHLNDIAKDHPDFVLARLRAWDRSQRGTAWIARHALRTLVKQGHAGALGLLGAGEPARLQVRAFRAEPARLRLGGTLTLGADLVSTARERQRLVLDYAIRYVKAGSRTHRKVFKWKEAALEPGAALALRKRQVIRDFSTRRHHPGCHEVELQANGRVVAHTAFTLRR
jgi:3-methyladenine DNA glycosylase AlkC